MADSFGISSLTIFSLRYPSQASQSFSPTREPTRSSMSGNQCETCDWGGEEEKRRMRRRENLKGTVGDSRMASRRREEMGWCERERREAMGRETRLGRGSGA